MAAAIIVTTDLPMALRTHELVTPMLAGDAAEPSGPEDALGSGKKRGDYSGVIGAREFYASVPNPDYDPSDPESPRSVLVHQNPLVEQRGDEKGVKGGTHSLSDELK